MENEDGSVLERWMDDLIQSRALVEVYRDRLNSSPFVGRLVRQSRHVFLMEKLGEIYRQDGWVVARTGDITRIKIGGRELDAAALLAPPAESERQFPDVALLELSSAMTIFQKEFGCVVVHVERISENICFVGEVRDLDDDFVVLRRYGTTKSMDKATLLLRLEEITSVEADGEYVRMLRPLISNSS
jgi:hypothetical protein